MKLLDALLVPPPSARVQVIPKSAKLDDAVRKLQQKYGFSKKRENSKDLEAKLLDFERRLDAGDWSSYPWHLGSELFRSFFTSELVEDDRWKTIASVFLDTLEGTGRKSYCRAALDVYLEVYDRAGAHFSTLRDILSEKRSADIPIRLELIEDLHLFDTARAHDMIGKVLSTSNDPYGLVKSWGIWSPHADGLFERAFSSMLDRLSADMRDMDEEPYRRVMGWLVPTPNIKAEASRAIGIDALVLPFQKVSVTPLRDEIEKFLLNTYGDPRIRKTDWAGVSDETLAIVRRWMTSKSLKVFFDVISQFESSHMWEPRKRFWTAIDERHWIDDAWVVLNNKGRREARRLAQQHNDVSFLSHGTLDFNEREKCFFILKIGNLVVIEGTNTFRVRIFNETSGDAPQFRAQSYSKPEIYALPRDEYGSIPQDPRHRGDVAFTHDRGENWMRKAEEYLRLNR